MTTEGSTGEEWANVIVLREAHAPRNGPITVCSPPAAAHAYARKSIYLSNSLSIYLSLWYFADFLWKVTATRAFIRRSVPSGARSALTHCMVRLSLSLSLSLSLPVTYGVIYTRLIISRRKTFKLCAFLSRLSSVRMRVCQTHPPPSSSNKHPPLQDWKNVGLQIVPISTC